MKKDLLKLHEVLIICFMFLGLGVFGYYYHSDTTTETVHLVDNYQNEMRPKNVHRITTRIIEQKPVYQVDATVTAYNTVPWQTDSTPCIAASGDDICGRDNVMACPSKYPLGTRVIMDGKDYECLDRTASKYDGRFDVSYDKDIAGARKFGRQYKTLEIVPRETFGLVK